jgi:hypothetical protein
MREHDMNCLRLEQALGPESAERLMELLPPVGWADVVTKRDLDALGDELLAAFCGELLASRMRHSPASGSGVRVDLIGTSLSRWHSGSGGRSLSITPKSSSGIEGWNFDTTR